MKKLLLITVAISSFATSVLAQQVTGFILNGGVGKPVADSSANPHPVTCISGCSGGGGGSTSVTATAAAPTYTEGSTTNPLSTGLKGGLRVYANDSSGADATDTTNHSVKVTVVSGVATGVAQGSTTSGQNGGLTQGATTTTAPSYTTATTNPLSLDVHGSLRILNMDSTGVALDPGAPINCGPTSTFVQCSTFAQQPVGAIGSAVPTNGIYNAASASGVLKGVISCDLHAIYDASDNGSKTIVAGTSSKKIYICGYILATGGTATNLSLSSGTGTDCVTTSVNITPAYQLVANDRTGANSSTWNGLITLANADNLCVKASAGNAHQAEIWYTVQ